MKSRTGTLSLLGGDQRGTPAQCEGRSSQACTATTAGSTGFGSGRPELTLPLARHSCTRHRRKGRGMQPSCHSHGHGREPVQTPLHSKLPRGQAGAAALATDTNKKSRLPQGPWVLWCRWESLAWPSRRSEGGWRARGQHHSHVQLCSSKVRGRHAGRSRTGGTAALQEARPPVSAVLAPTMCGTDAGPETSSTAVIPETAPALNGTDFNCDANAERANGKADGTHQGTGAAAETQGLQKKRQEDARHKSRPARRAGEGAGHRGAAAVTSSRQPASRAHPDTTQECRKQSKPVGHKQTHAQVAAEGRRAGTSRKKV